ncbi:hypothetical protein C0991_006201, partial [Blastosporella zonata]
LVISNGPWIILAPRTPLPERDARGRFSARITTSNTTSSLTSLTSSPTSSLLSSDTLDTVGNASPVPSQSNFSLHPGIIPPPNSPKPETPKPRDTTDDMPDDKPTLFWGDIGRAGEDPQDFINSIELRFIGRANATDADRINYFRLSLKTASDAHVWFKGLDEDTKRSWDRLKVAFDSRWPERVVAAKTMEEKSSTLRATELKSSDVGKRITINGVEEWSHIAWADKVERLAGAIPDTGGLLISEARKKLPTAIRTLLTGSHTSWTSFCNEVRELPVERIQESDATVQAQARLERELENLKRVQQTPSKALASQFQRSFSIGNPVPAPRFVDIQAPAPTPARRQPPPPNNTTTTATSPTPYIVKPWAERWADVERNTLPTHPNTPEGRALYTAQLADWAKKHGMLRPNETRPYPLRPGSLPVASSDCWACGLGGHVTNNCPNLGQKAPENESRWRSVAATIKRNVGRTVEIPVVNFIEDSGLTTYTKEEYDAQVIADFLANQGKAEGSST